ncbi:UNVERIFIED_CONTAM: hypothetical protein DES50_101723 [Williamsia faeni]
MSSEIEDYYIAVNSGRLEDAVEMMAEDVQAVLVLPTGVKHAEGRVVMLGNLRARPPVDREHHILRFATDGDMQFAYGLVTENDTAAGDFVGVVQLDAQGKIARYQVTYDMGLTLLPAEGA